MQISLSWLLFILPEGLFFSVSCQSWFPSTSRNFFLNPCKSGGFGGVCLVTSAFSPKRNKAPFSPFSSSFQASHLSSTFWPPVNPWPCFRCLFEAHCQIWVVLTQREWLMASELAASLPPSQGDYPCRSQDQKRFTHTAVPPRGEEGHVLSACIHTGTECCKTLSYTEKFDRF